MAPCVLLIALALRSLALLLPHTYFQPDEFYQAFEPAYARVFGSGYITWEWRDLPANGGDGWWDTVVAGGRLRGWAWPGVFVLVYQAVRALGAERFIALAPRLVGVVVAALTDYYTYKLAEKVLSRRSASTALFLSLTSLFNAQLLPRALSTSPETLLTVAALYYYPLELGTRDKASDKKLSDKPHTNGTKKATVRRYDYSAIDREEQGSDTTTSLVLSAALASLSICIRPTMLVFWGYLSLEQTVVAWRKRGVSGVLGLIIKTTVGGLTVFAASTALDYYMMGRLAIPILSFFHRNVVMNIAAFYGATGLTYHLVQSLPILLFPLWSWWGQGFLSSLLPKSSIPASLAHLDRPVPLRTLARAVTFTIAALSLSPHSEWRFVHPLLPILLMFAIPALQVGHRPRFIGADDVWTAFKQYFRMSHFAFQLILVASLLPYLYLNAFHGGAQVSVTNALRTGAYGPVDSLTVLMPCHSTPWASHLGDIADRSWFLTCEPPLTPDAAYRTQQEAFYDAPVTYLRVIFPFPPDATSGLHASLPSHILLFGCLLDEAEDGVTFGQVLAESGYTEVANLWNGFDVAQDEEKRAGGVRVWRRKDTIT